MKLLISAGADPNILHGQNGYTPLHEAIVEMALYPWNIKGNQIVKMLLNAGADPEKEDASGKTPLDLAPKVTIVYAKRALLELLHQHRMTQH